MPFGHVLNIVGALGSVEGFGKDPITKRQVDI